MLLIKSSHKILKISKNKIMGFFFFITKTNKKMPLQSWKSRMNKIYHFYLQEYFFVYWINLFYINPIDYYLSIVFGLVDNIVGGSVSAISLELSLFVFVSLLQSNWRSEVTKVTCIYTIFLWVTDTDTPLTLNPTDQSDLFRL